jgi:hypothetical protein
VTGFTPNGYGTTFKLLDALDAIINFLGKFAGKFKRSFLRLAETRNAGVLLVHGVLTVNIANNITDQ